MKIEDFFLFLALKWLKHFAYQRLNNLFFLSLTRSLVCLLLRPLGAFSPDAPADEDKSSLLLHEKFFSFVAGLENFKGEDSDRECHKICLRQLFLCLPKVLWVVGLKSFNGLIPLLQSHLARGFRKKPLFEMLIETMLRKFSLLMCSW